MAEVDNTGDRRVTAQQNPAAENAERLLAETRAVTPAQPTDAVPPATTAQTSDVNPPGVLARGADGVEIYDPQAERLSVGMDRAREALDSGRPQTIRVFGQEQAQQMVGILRDRDGSIQLAKATYEVHKVEITSNSLVSSSENYVNTTRDVQVTTPDGEKITIDAKSTLPAGTIIEADGRIRAAHPDDAGITVNGRLIPNGSTIGDRTALNGGQNAVPGQIIPTRKITDLAGNRVVDGYPLTPVQFEAKYEGNGNGRFQNKNNPTPIEHVQVPDGVTIEYVKLVNGQPELDANGNIKVESYNRAGSMFRGDGYSLTPDILFSTWNKVVDVNNADKLLAMYEQRGLSNSEEARAMRTNRDALANSEARANFKASGGLSNAQLELIADHSSIVTDPAEAARKAVAREALRADTHEKRSAAIRALNEGPAAQVKFLNGLKSTSGAIGSVAALTAAALSLIAAGTEAKAQEKAKVTFRTPPVPVR